MIAAIYTMLVVNHFYDGYYVSQYYGQLHYGIEYLLHENEIPIINEQKMSFYNTDIVSFKSITFEDISDALIQKIDSLDNDVALYIALYEMSVELGHTYYTYPIFVDFLYGFTPMNDFDRSDFFNWSFVLTTCPDSYYYYDNVSDALMATYVDKYISDVLAITE
uniref:Uncharacterized protein n=1 Tax=Histiona aroides TaxID=392300 RepID=M4Q9Q3_HISAR|nr:hypothetical protein L075_p002 [Histiona aroides]AGH24101.1 hypothetical protein [Histiona aroides]